MVHGVGAPVKIFFMVFQFFLQIFETTTRTTSGSRDGFSERVNSIIHVLNIFTFIYLTRTIFTGTVFFLGKVSCTKQTHRRLCPALGWVRSIGTSRHRTTTSADTRKGIERSEGHMKKVGLVPRLLLGIAAGIAVGHLPSRRGVASVVHVYPYLRRVSKLYRSVYHSGVHCPGYSRSRRQGGDVLLGSTVLIAYGSTIVAGLIAFLVGSWVVPAIVAGSIGGGSGSGGLDAVHRAGDSAAPRRHDRPRDRLYSRFGYQLPDLQGREGRGSITSCTSFATSSSW